MNQSSSSIHLADDIFPPREGESHPELLRIIAELERPAPTNEADRKPAVRIMRDSPSPFAHD